MITKRLFYFNIIFACNNNCKYCCSHNTRNHNVASVDIEYIQKVHLEYGIASEDYIILTGGEPTLSPHFLKIVRYLSALTTHVILYTNGRLLWTYDQMFLDKIERIIIPIYGGKENHNSYIGVANGYEDTIKSIEYINAFQPNKLEIKLVVDNNDSLLSIVNSDDFSTLSITENISVNRLIKSDNDLCDNIIDTNLIQQVENLIFTLHEQGKSIKFYDWPLCYFSNRFKDMILSNYDGQGDLMFDIVNCPANRKPYRVTFNRKTNCYEKCRECTLRKFCSQIMRRYYCPVLKNNKVIIGVE